MTTPSMEEAAQIRDVANTLDYFFEVKEIRRLESCPKLFAVCEKRD